MAKIDKEYHKLLQTILKDGFTYEDPNRKGVNRIQIPSYQFIHKFEDGFPAITTKKLFWKGVVGELLWFLRGDTNIKYLVDNGINIWNKDLYVFRKKQGIKMSYDNFYKMLEKTDYIGNGDLGRIYGAQWKSFGQGKEWDASQYDETKGVDQISNLIRNLKEKPMSTEHLVTAWNPAELDDMALPPCHWSFQILVEPLNVHKRAMLYRHTDDNWEKYGTYREDLWDELNIPKYGFTLKWNQRSVDSFLGLPFNIASYALLAEIIGKLTNMKPLGIQGDLTNVHIYESHLNAVKEQLSRSTDMYNSRCELIHLKTDDFYKNLSESLSLFGHLDIKDFKLSEHSEQDNIKAEMLSRD
jgi:thymidylate synthase